MEFVIDASLVCISGPAYPLACLGLPLAPCTGAEPRLPVLLPSHYHHQARGAARALRGEAAGSGHSGVSARAHTRYMV